jgi:hypothetical protein
MGPWILDQSSSKLLLPKRLLATDISAVITQMVGRVATVANQALVVRNWMVGAYIVEFEQDSADRAKYGTRLLETLAEDLK